MIIEAKGLALSYLKEIKEFYPDIETWYLNKVLFNKSRKEFIFLYNNKIAGIAIIKEKNPPKLSTFFIRKDFRGKGLGRKFLAELLDKYPQLYVTTASPEAANFFRKFAVEEKMVFKPRYNREEYYFLLSKKKILSEVTKNV